MDLRERRRHHRVIVWQAVTLVPFHGGGPLPPIDGTLVDISEGGALVETGYELPAGQPAALYLSPGPAVTALRSRVVRATESAGYLLHLRFLDQQTDQAREALTACLTAAPPARLSP